MSFAYTENKRIKKKESLFIKLCVYLLVHNFKIYQNIPKNIFIKTRNNHRFMLKHLNIAIHCGILNDLGDMTHMRSKNTGCKNSISSVS